MARKLVHRFGLAQPWWPHPPGDRRSAGWHGPSWPPGLATMYPFFLGYITCRVNDKKWDSKGREKCRTGRIGKLRCDPAVFTWSVVTIIWICYGYRVLPCSPCRFFFSLAFCGPSAFRHNQADLNRFMHMRQPWRNYLLNFHSTMIIMLTLAATALLGANLLYSHISNLILSWVFGSDLHGGVISGRWCLKLVLGLILLMFLLSFCCRFAIVFVSRRFSKSVVRGTYLICSYTCWRRISSCIVTRRSLESPCI